MLTVFSALIFSDLAAVCFTFLMIDAWNSIFFSTSFNVVSSISDVASGATASGVVSGVSSFNSGASSIGFSFSVGVSSITSVATVSNRRR